MSPRVTLLLSLLLSLLLVLTLSATAASAASSPQLVATSSSWFVVGRNAHVQITVLHVQDPVVAVVNLMAVGSSVVLATTSVTITPSSVHSSPTATAVLAVPSSLADSTYTLQVTASNTGIVPENIPTVTSTVAVSTVSRAVFVQTDKAMYQAAQKVKIAVVAGKKHTHRKQKKNQKSEIQCTRGLNSILLCALRPSLLLLLFLLVDYDLKPVASLPYTVELVSPSNFKIHRVSSVTTDAFGFGQHEYQINQEPEQGVVRRRNTHSNMGVDRTERNKTNNNKERLNTSVKHPVLICFHFSTLLYLLSLFISYFLSFSTS